LMRCWQRLIR